MCAQCKGLRINAQYSQQKKAAKPERFPLEKAVGVPTMRSAERMDLWSGKPQQGPTRSRDGRRLTSRQRDVSRFSPMKNPGGENR